MKVLMASRGSETFQISTVNRGLLKGLGGVLDIRMVSRRSSNGLGCCWNGLRIF